MKKRIKRDFPFFNKNPDTVFLDSAASSLTPIQVSNAVRKYNEEYGVNIHRGVYKASQEATEVYEETRNVVKEFLNSGDDGEVIYTRNATESLNLVANCLSQVNGLSMEGFHAWQDGFKPNDVIILSESEHHANIVPWQMLAEKHSLEIVYIPIRLKNGALDIEAFERLKKKYENACVKVVSLAHVSNVTGIAHDLTPFRDYAREKGAIFIVDGAQSVCHTQIYVQEIDCDFFVFSAHKMLGPTGIGILWGRKNILERFPPFMGGGDMILSVSKEKTIYNQAPHKFEAGTPDISGVFGLRAAIEYLQKYGMQNLTEREESLTNYALEQMESIGLKIYGPSHQEVQSGLVKKASVISFGIDNIHPHDVGTILDQEKIAIRTGHHCCQILMDAWKVPATCRASFYIYNDKEDVDHLINAVSRVRKVFS